MIHAFTFQNPRNGETEYLLLDVESGALINLDAAAYAVAEAIEEGQDPYSVAYPKELVAEILGDFEELRQQGMFQSEKRTPEARSEEAVIKAVCLHVAHDCNLRCAYCFAATGEFQGERMLMPFETASAALDFLMLRSKGRKNLEVDLFGGEPLMNFDVVRQIVSYGRELEKKHQKVIRFTMTTNALALTDERMHYLNENMHNIVLSLDGRKEIHDALRKTVNGQGSYDHILPQIQKMVRLRGDGEYYVRGTFTNRNLDFVEDVRALRDAGFEQISMEPVVLDDASPYAIRKEHVARICEEYDKLCRFVIESEEEGKWFHFFHFYLDLANGPCLNKRIAGCGAGTEYVAVTPDGDLYPCHQFVGEEPYCMGNVHTGVFQEQIAKAFLQCNVRTKAACKACWAKYFCSGGCAANAWKYNGDIFTPGEVACALERKRTECALGLHATAGEA
ncbi:thioether cross-link-forming SCIFF peptide maturase [Christensenellaceae bacterium OttesenSCG-928-L17]|nr:thioether cross-link-forming SCIFF peptide maturase [Christensenellaceae bacterium OttesenSCG-928-L17]